MYEMLLERLGQALYTHAKHAAQAEQALEAVDYLDEKGVFKDDASETPIS